MDNQEKKPALDRRSFLMNILKVSGQVALANTAIYSISLIGGKGRLGNMAAGAKTMVTCYCGNMDGGCYSKANGPDGCYEANPICNGVPFPEPPGCPSG